MKITKKNLVGFLKKATMSAEQGISEAILDFQKDGLKLNANSPPKQVRVMAWLKTSAFKEYEEIGKVGMNDLANVIKVLERFDELLTLTVEGNLLTVKSGSKKVEIELISEAFLTTDDGEPKLEFAETFTLDNGKVKEIVGDVSLNKDAYLKIETAEKKVLFSNTGKYKFHSEVEAPACKGGVIVNFGKPLVDSIASLDSDLIFSVSTDYPTKVMEKTEDAIITLIVAPRMPDE